MTKYDFLFTPPAPVVRVDLRAVGKSQGVGDVMLLMDTGADTTLLPRGALERLGVRPIQGETNELVGFDGTRIRAEVVEVDMVFLRKIYRGRYAVIDDECGVLGRDVLNHVGVLFDGPAGEWSEHSASRGRRRHS